MANFYPPGLEDKVKTIAIDFDGVIHDAKYGWGDGTCYGEPLEGSLESIRLLSKNFKIVIFTCKAREDRPLVENKNGIELVNEWLKKYEIFDCIDSVTSIKPRAELYIDDNAIRFDNWIKTLTFIDTLWKNID